MDNSLAIGRVQPFRVLTGGVSILAPAMPRHTHHRSVMHKLNPIELEKKIRAPYHSHGYPAKHATRTTTLKGATSKASTKQLAETRQWSLPAMGRRVMFSPT
jgi:hypothetical protein